jgi:mono/diheme cytochrome c family protein
MHHRPAILLVGCLALALGSAAQAADVAHGKTLHESNCIACHSSMTNGQPSSLYTRPDRRVTSLAGLEKQVRRCELSLGLTWFDDDIGDVVAYLNEQFYKLK